MDGRAVTETRRRRRATSKLSSLGMRDVGPAEQHTEGRGGGGGGGGGGDGDGDGGSTVRRTTSDAAFGGSTAPRAPAGGGRGGEDELGAVSAPRAAVVGGGVVSLIVGLVGVERIRRERMTC
uniref:Uncharacterized protein n=1 Tax=Vespula pensylvanica TaxID=30213 RepID=A0A834JPY3_VESPE|nr:hypothetical protein H0235_017363 [Vespula pensylvanica]